MHAGELLVKLDDRDYRAALAKATGAVAAQEAFLANIDATRRLQELMIARAAAELAAADAEVARSQSDVERYRRLASDQYASLQRFSRPTRTIGKQLPRLTRRAPPWPRRSADWT